MPDRLPRVRSTPPNRRTRSLFRGQPRRRYSHRKPGTSAAGTIKPDQVGRNRLTWANAFVSYPLASVPAMVGSDISPSASPVRGSPTNDVGLGPIGPAGAPNIMLWIDTAPVAAL